jgi:hypothetical protein
VEIQQSLVAVKNGLEVLFYLTGFWIEGSVAGGTFGSFLQIIGKNIPFLTALWTFDFHFTQRLIAFKSRTMLICHNESPLLNF